MTLLLDLLEKNRLPDWLVRAGIRRLLAQRLRDEARKSPVALRAHQERLIRQWHAGPIAVNEADANAQHYEVPSRFFKLVLGRRLKYSGGLWQSPDATLDESEEAMLALTCERAGISDGMAVLDLGCGWGSFSLYAAERFPNCHITALSNSRTQKQHIEGQCERRGLHNVCVITANIADCSLDMQVDRVVSVEMFEHMRNHEALLAKIARWMKPGARLFVHLFGHRELLYPFEARGEWDWMARHFFTGGMMPSAALLAGCQRDLRLAKQWEVDGTHYQRTCEAWLSRMDAHRTQITPLFSEVYGPTNTVKWWAYWRVFFMACAELFGYRGGTEWMVFHYLFEKPAATLR